MSTKEEMIRRQYNYINQMSAQQAALGGLGNYAQSIGQMAQRQNPLIGVDITSIPMSEIEMMLTILTKEYDRRTMDTPLTGPTRRQLQADETLKRAWEEFEVLRKLKGK